MHGTRTIAACRASHGVPAGRTDGLRHDRDGRPAACAAFLGDQDLISHLVGLLRAPDLRVELDLLPVLRPAPGESRQALAERARAAVAAVLTGSVALSQDRHMACLDCADA